MNKKLKKTLVSSLSVAVLSMSAAGMVSASNGATTSIPTNISIQNESNSEVKLNTQQFASITGIVQEITNYNAVENAKLVELKASDNSITHFVVTDATYIMDELTIGTEMMAFYDQQAPTILIFPPQYKAVVIAAVNEERNIVVDHFNSELVNTDNTLQLNPSDDTKIVTTDGTAFEGEITDRLLAVTYTVSTRSIPAQTNPAQITVLDNKEIVEETPEVKADYAEVRGTIKSINPAGIDGKQQLVEVQLDKDNIVYLNVSDLTFVDEKFEVGAEIIAFYNANAPMIMIYPPRYNVSAVALVKEDRQIMVDRFDSTLKNSTGNLVLNIGKDTKVLTADGKSYEGSLQDKNLFIEYTITTKSIPAQTTPVRVVVLEDEAAPIEEKSIVIDGQTVEAPAAYADENGVVMVPIRAIAEALGYEVGWENKTQGITLGKAISLQVGKDSYTFAKMAPIELGTAPIIVEGNTYVPLNFFTDVAQLSEAATTNKEIVINK
ncbi:MAG TPA: copper amine oxidase N-terminal domain-containing protein [Candidatus Paenibacillus intestinavium]|nr:copper amine oxidase N-terminal domain-containing protein [Candidatus Paenibacillus intestinavium]